MSKVLSCVFPFLLLGCYSIASYPAGMDYSKTECGEIRIATDIELVSIDDPEFTSAMKPGPSYVLKIPEGIYEMRVRSTLGYIQDSAKTLTCIVENGKKYSIRGKRNDFGTNQYWMVYTFQEGFY